MLNTVIPLKHARRRGAAATRSPLRIGMVTSSQILSTGTGSFVRIEADDLRAAAKRTAHARVLHPDETILLDVDVAIASDVRTACHELELSSPQRAGKRLLYVGSTSGLAGLIRDLYVLGIADGSVITPLTAQQESRAVFDHLCHELGIVRDLPSRRQSRS